MHSSTQSSAAFNEFQYSQIATAVSIKLHCVVMLYNAPMPALPLLLVLWLFYDAALGVPEGLLQGNAQLGQLLYCLGLSSAF